MKVKIIVLAVLFFAVCIPAFAQDNAGPENFLRHVYARYGDKSAPPDYANKDAASVFDPALAALIIGERDAANKAGEVPYLDGDPICDCQDSKGLTLHSVAVQTVKADTAQATVSLSLAQGHRTLHFDLVTVKDAWRIHDIRSDDNASLAEALQDSLAQRSGGTETGK